MEEGLKVIGVSVTEQGLELLVGDTAEQRRGLGVAHSYFIEFSSESFGQRAQDVIDDLTELAQDVHIGWKRQPKVTKE